MLIFPAVKHMKIESGCFHPWRLVYGFIGESMKEHVIKQFSFLSRDLKNSSNIIFTIDHSLGDEAYRLKIDEENITVFYSSEKGAYYALITLEQLMHQEEYSERIPCLSIHDEPELSIRGFMLDISRNKIPTIKTIQRLIDHMSRLKYNHLELYVEGMSYFYPSLHEVYRDDQTPWTPHDFLACQKYAAEHMIDLVPCHNGLGHMTEWLTVFPELAELEGGMYMWGAHRPASTLNPLAKESFDFVKKIYHDAVSGSISNYFHMNLDEPYELGHGKSRKKAEEVGVGQVYLDYVVKLYQLMTSYHKTPLIWGDVLNHYPEKMDQLPKDLIFVDWGYDFDYPFYERLKRLSEKGVSFMAAPGTSSWNSISGRTQDMMENIYEACRWTKAFGGLGILLTDWGDNGHWQSLLISYPALVYAGLESWRGHVQNRYLIKKVIDQWFKDTSHSIGQLLLDLGTYDRFQPAYLSNRTALMDLMILKRYKNQDHSFSHVETILSDHPFANITTYDHINTWLKDINQRASDLKISKEFKWVDDQLKLTIVLLNISFLFIVTWSKEISEETRKKHLHELKSRWPILLEKYKKVWLESNKHGGLKTSMESLEFMYDMIISKDNGLATR